VFNNRTLPITQSEYPVSLRF